jgi:hypothetical protein
MAAMFGYHGGHAHNAHHQKNREEDNCDYQNWHTAPLPLLSLGDERGAVTAVTARCEMRQRSRGGWQGKRRDEELPENHGGLNFAGLAQICKLSIQTGQGAAQQLRITLVAAAFQLLQNPLARKHQVIPFNAGL